MIEGLPEGGIGLGSPRRDQELPDRLPAGPWLVTSVRHQVDATRGGRTRVEAVVAGSALDSALGAALGAIGGLL